MDNQTQTQSPQPQPEPQPDHKCEVIYVDFIGGLGEIGREFV